MYQPAGLTTLVLDETVGKAFGRLPIAAMSLPNLA